MEVFLQVLTVVLLIVGNAFFVAAEFALVSVRRTRIDQLVEEGNRTAKMIAAVMQEPSKFISSTQVGITLCSLGLGFVGEPTLSRFIEPVFEHLLGGLGTAVAHTISFAISFGLVTYLLTVIGEIVPKTIGLHFAERVAFLVVWPLEAFYFVFKPFIWLLNASADVMVGVFGLKVSKAAHMVHSEEELKMLVQASHEGGVLEEEERALVNKAFEFADITVDEVMVPRPDMAAIDADAGFEAIVELAGQTHHTRLPVYEGSLDHILGFVHVKDLLARIDDAEKPTARMLVRPILAVPENKPVAEMLKEFRRARTQVAIVVDEFGGTMGLVTIEDLIEELVGDLSDEFETAISEIERQSDGTFLLDGKVAIGDLNERFGLELPEEEFNTIAGLVFGEIGHTPEIGDEVEVDGTRFRVEETNGRRATRIRMIPELSPPEATAD